MGLRYAFISVILLLGCVAESSSLADNTSVRYQSPDVSSNEAVSVIEPAAAELTLNNSRVNNSEIKNSSLVQVYFYYSPICPFSHAIAPYVDLVATKYANSTEWHRFNVLDSLDILEYNAMAAQFNLTEGNGRVVPIIVIGNTSLSGMFEINRSLESLIINMSQAI